MKISVSKNVTAARSAAVTGNYRVTGFDVTKTKNANENGEHGVILQMSLTNVKDDSMTVDMAICNRSNSSTLRNIPLLFHTISHIAGEQVACDVLAGLDFSEDTAPASSEESNIIIPWSEEKEFKTSYFRFGNAGKASDDKSEIVAADKLMEKLEDVLLNEELHMRVSRKGNIFAVEKARKTSSRRRR